MSINARLAEIESRKVEIESRKVEIRNLLETDEKANLDELEVELKGLEVERKGLEDEEKELRKRLEIARGVQAGTVQTRTVAVMSHVAATSKTAEELVASPEYRSTYLKWLQGRDLTDAEQRALTTAAGSAGPAVPTQTLNMVIDKMRQTSALFPRVNVSYVPGNLSIVVANAKNAATWKPEGQDGTPADDTVVDVTLTGYELIKLVEISAAAQAMTIDAFEAYIANEIGRQMAIAVENAILNGSGSGEPTGILPGITWNANNSTTWDATGDVDYDHLVDGLALLPTMYHNNAVFVMNRKMLFGGIRKIKTSDNQPIFAYNPQDRAAMTILGYPVILDDYMLDDTILLGDFSYYYLNFAQAPTIDVSREAAFKSGKVTYRGLAVADGKPALAEAFVKISKASV